MSPPNNEAVKTQLPKQDALLLPNADPAKNDAHVLDAAGRPTKRIKSNNNNDNNNNLNDKTEEDGNNKPGDSHVVSSSSTDSSRIGPPFVRNDDAPYTTSTDASATDVTTNSTTNNATTTTTLQCLKLLCTPLPSSLTSGSNNNNNENETISNFRELWTIHGFRTTMVTSPRPAVSVYLDSCGGLRHDTTITSSTTNNNNPTLVQNNEAGRQYLQTIIGMHPHQTMLEAEYTNSIKNVYCLMLFLKRMRSVRKEDMEDARLTPIILPWEQRVNDLLNSTFESTDIQTKQILLLQELNNSSPRILSLLLSKLTEIDHSLRNDQLLHEYNRISYENCTLANACLQRWLTVDDNDNDNDNNNSGRKKANTQQQQQQRYELDQVYYKPSPPNRYLPKYERITIHFKDPNAVEPNHAKLIFLPSLTQVLTAKMMIISQGGDTTTGHHPLDLVANDMVTSTWKNLLRNGYYVDQTRKEQLGPVLHKFYMSGLLGGKEGNNMPILLNAHFTPTYPLSLYLHGTAGAGKSSLVRALLPALNSAIATHCDPELLVRFVKQNLNKPFATLQLELDLRPNNNDYSVMSIIQGRRMTLAQSKPGLVLVALEEMPSNVEGADPNQGDVGRLIGMRFSGRKGELRKDAGVEVVRRDAPRNSAKRGISGDATIMSIFTSNYDLEQSCLESLQRLDMFKNLTIIEVAPVAGNDRMSFSLSYLTQRVEESLLALSSCTGSKVDIKLDIPYGEGDTRPLVRYLRMLSFYIHALVLRSNPSLDDCTIDVSVSFNASTNITTITTKSGEERMELKPGSFSNLYAITPPKLDSRASNTVAQLQKLHPNLQNPMELSQILDFYFAKTLAPAVILSHDKQLIGDLIKVLAKSDGVHGISDIDPTRYKMMKSLYDSSDTPNLRDDILQILHSNGDEGVASVAVELVCQTTDAQLQIREIIEDTPSMTAFSTEKSALKKDGLLFGVFVDGEITPEIESRASLMI
ncbi:hypothetical protein ACHAXR_008440 [Thalassiosira sp. AJA248-18]